MNILFILGLKKIKTSIRGHYRRAVTKILYDARRCTSYSMYINDIRIKRPNLEKSIYIHTRCCSAIRGKMVLIKQSSYGVVSRRNSVLGIWNFYEFVLFTRLTALRLSPLWTTVVIVITSHGA